MRISRRRITRCNVQDEHANRLIRSFFLAIVKSPRQHAAVQLVPATSQFKMLRTVFTVKVRILQFAL